jgi:hypothetical protein
VSGQEGRFHAAYCRVQAVEEEDVHGDVTLATGPILCF